MVRTQFSASGVVQMDKPFGSRNTRRSAVLGLLLSGAALVASPAMAQEAAPPTEGLSDIIVTRDAQFRIPIEGCSVSFGCFRGGTRCGRGERCCLASHCHSQPFGG
jgi:hypothetical protein